MADSPNPHEPDNNVDGHESNLWVWLGRLFRLGLIAVIAGVCGWIAYYWMMNQPQAQRRPPASQAALVETHPLARKTERVVLTGLMGPVIPARKIQIAARVNGQVVEVSDQFMPGGIFKEKERILLVEPKDYLLAVEQAQGNLTKAESEVRLEMGQQAVAKSEYEMLGQSAVAEDEELLLRQPQLASKKAASAIAKAQLDKARLDLERTHVYAPFNATVLTRNADTGSYVTPGSSLAELVCTDMYWIELTVPVDELKWISVPADKTEQGSPARIYHEPSWGPGVCREGRVIRRLAAVDPQGKMARVLVSVEDPLHMAKPLKERDALLLEAIVSVEIDGIELPGVVEIPRTALHEGAKIWIMNPDGTLAIRDVRIAWTGAEHVYISDGAADGEMLVTSELGAPMPGMLLRTGSGKEPTKDVGDGAPA